MKIIPGMLKISILIILLIVSLTYTPLNKRAACSTFAQTQKEESVIVTASNPDKETLPTLGVWQRDDLILVSADFPNIPDFTCDSWCYESAVDFVSAASLDGGRVELRHRDRNQPHVLIVTTVNPEPEAVEFVARVELDRENYPDSTMPKNPPGLNLCWQLRRAALFASAPDPYPQFVQRCFIFTSKGMTFLNNTERRKIPCRPPDHEYNNPPGCRCMWDNGRKFQKQALSHGQITARISTAQR